MIVRGMAKICAFSNLARPLPYLFHPAHRPLTINRELVK